MKRYPALENVYGHIPMDVSPDLYDDPPKERSGLKTRVNPYDNDLFLAIRELGDFLPSHRIAQLVGCTEYLVWTALNNRKRLTITLKGDPVPFARAGRNGKITYTPKKQKDFMDALGYAAKASMGAQKLFSCPLTINYTAYFQRAKSNKDIFMTKTPDIDNMVKIALDSLNKIVFEDDRLVVDLKASKKYTDTNPRIEITISKLGR